MAIIARRRTIARAVTTIGTAIKDRSATIMVRRVHATARLTAATGAATAIGVAAATGTAGTVVIMAAAITKDTVGTDHAHPSGRGR
jgi:hypothetical protein